MSNASLEIGIYIYIYTFIYTFICIYKRYQLFGDLSLVATLYPLSPFSQYPFVVAIFYGNLELNLSWPSYYSDLWDRTLLILGELSLPC